MFTKEHQRLLAKYKQENKPTKEELIVEQVLKELKIRYIAQKGFLAKAYTCYIADFYLPKPYKIIIEVDGSSHNGKEYYDSYRDKFFKEERGIRTIRIQNEELQDLDKVRYRLKVLK